MNSLRSVPRPGRTSNLALLPAEKLFKPKSVIRHAESVFDWESEAFGHLARLCPHPDSARYAFG